MEQKNIMEQKNAMRICAGQGGCGQSLPKDGFLINSIVILGIVVIFVCVVGGG